MNISKIVKFGVIGLVTGALAGFAGADQERTSLVHDILSETDRASFLDDSSSATVNVHGFTQFRWTYNNVNTDGVDSTHGFSVPRTRLEISGNLYNWDYVVSGQWDDGDSFTLKDAYANLGKFQVGQFKSPFMKEVLTSSTDTLATERSVVSNQFGQGRSQGLQYSRDMRFGTFTSAYTDGFNTSNGAGVQNGYALTSRVDFDVNSWTRAGIAVSHNDLDTTTYNTWTADATFSAVEFDINGAYVATSDDDWGTVWTASYECTDKMQGFVQYENGHLDGVDTNLSIVTVGVNYALDKNVKWTTDLGKSLDDIDSGWDLSNSGWNTTASDGELLLRSQVQVTF